MSLGYAKSRRQATVSILLTVNPEFRAATKWETGNPEG
jgi:hypothetical protein